MRIRAKNELKRWISGILSVLMLIGILHTPLVLAYEDSKFESFTGWTFSGDDTLSFADGVTGYAAEITKEKGEASYLYSDIIKVTEGGKYNIGINAKAVTENAPAVTLWVQGFADSNGNTAVGDPVEIAALSSETDDFTKLSGDYTAAEGVLFIRAAVSIGNDASKSEDIYLLDEAYVYAYSEAAPIYDSNTADGYNSGEWFRYPDGTGAQWSNNEIRYAETVENGYTDGNKGALHIVNNAASGDIWLSIITDGAVADKEYTVSLKVKGSVTSAAQTFRFVDRTNIDLSKYNITNENVSFADWTDFSYTYTSNGSNEFFLIFSQYNNQSDIYIDNIKVTDSDGNDILNGKGDFANTTSSTLITANNLVSNGSFEALEYEYLPIEEFNGTFDGAETEEKIEWTLSGDDQDKIDIAEDSDTSHGNVLKVTKGSDADTRISAPRISVESGRSYSLSFDLKGEGSYSVAGSYNFADGSTSSEITIKSGTVSADWQTLSGLNITDIPANVTSVNLYIVYKGSSGNILYIDNAAVNPLKRKASIANWDGTDYNATNLSEISYIELVEDGCQDIGAVHFIQDYNTNNAKNSHRTIGISNLFTTGVTGKTYVFSAYIKGSAPNVVGADPMYIELYWGKGTWADSNSSALKITGEYSDWTKVSYEFTVNKDDYAPIYIGAGGYSGVDFYIDNVTVTEKNGDGSNLLLNGGFNADLNEPDTSVNLITAGDFEDLQTVTVPGWTVLGNVSLDANGILDLKANTSLTSYRYDVNGGDIYKISYVGDSGNLRVEFNKGGSYNMSGSDGYFIVPDGAENLKVIYSSGNSVAEIKSITLEKVQTPENFDFELKDPSAEKPLNWNGYNVSGDESIYSLGYSEDEGENGSAAMLITAEKDNSSSYVVYSKRIEAKSNYVYSVSFSGKYSGTDIKVSPLIRTYNSYGNDTVEATSYNWLIAAQSENNDGKWHTYSANVTTGPDTAFIEVRFEVASKYADGKFLFDNITLTAQGSAENTNFDFETGNANEQPFNWSVYERREKSDSPGEYEEGSFGAYTVYKAENAGYDGSAAAAIKKNTVGATDLYFVSSVFELKPDTNYTLSYEALTRNTKKGSIYVCLRQYKDLQLNNVSDEAQAFCWLTGAYAYGSFDWQTCGTSFKTSSETNYAIIWFVFTGEEELEAYLDNIKFVETEEITDPNLDFEYTAGGKPVNWDTYTSSGIATVASDSEVYYRGNNSVRINKKYSEINYTILTMSNGIEIVGGDDIEFVVHLRSANSVSANFAASITYYDKNGKEIQSCVGQDRPLNSSSTLSEWDTYSVSYAAPKNAAKVKISLRIGGKNADVYIDSVEYYNYTESGNTVYAEDFLSASSDGMFGGWSSSVISGNPTFETNDRAGISGGKNDNGAIETDIKIIKSEYVYEVTAQYSTSGTAEGRFIIDAYNWRDQKTRTFITQDIKNAESTQELVAAFTADSSVYYRIRFEKTGGEGTVYLRNIVIKQTGEPATANSWEGKWIVYPDDYNSIETHTHNERYYYFRQEINLASEVKTAQMQITADDKFAVYVNGTSVYEETRTGDTWDLPVTIDIAEYLTTGKNVIAFRMYNDIYAYGLLYDGIIKFEDGTEPLRFYSDTNVLVARESYGADNISDPNWTEYDEKNYMNVDYDVNSSDAWVNATVYTEVGGGSWGTIDFDNSEYSDYKLETDEFNFPKSSVYAGDTIEVTAKITISEQMPETSTFDLHFWKKNSTKKICSGTLTISEGSAADWPIGKEFEAKFTLRIPDFLAEGSYTVQFDSSVAIVSDYYINNKVGSIKVVQLEREVTTTSEIKMYNGKPTYFVNDIASAPLWFSRPERDSTYKQETLAGFADAGIDTNIAFILPNATLGELWLSDGSIQTETIDQQMLGTLSANPEGKLLIAIDTTPPQWWLDENPEECVKLSNGTISKNSFSSEKWKKETGEVILKIIDYLMQQPYANNIVGFKNTGGSTFEWQWWGMNGDSVNVGDFSSVGLTAFRKWLRETYKTDSALQAAWNDSSVTIDTAEVPTISARSESEYGSILSAQNSRNVIDYELFMGEMKSEATLYFADLIKKATDDRLIVGTYAGYLLNCWTYEFATTTGQTATQMLLESDSLDFIVCPWIYGERELGYSNDYMSLADSITAHGKLYVAEDDNRNNAYLSFAQDSRASVGWTRTVEQAIEQLKRNFSYALTKGQGLYFYDLGGTYFVEEAFYEMASQMMQEMTLSLGLERESVADIAVFVDEQSIAYFPYTSNDTTNELLFKSIMKTQREELNNIGTSYDLYLLDDLEKGLVPEHKINIMLSASQVTESEREAIEKQLQKNGNIIVWQFIGGISDGETTDISNIEELIGFNLEIIDEPTDERKLIGTVNVTNYDHWLTKGLSDVTYGATEYRTLSPVIAVSDDTATALGVHSSQTGYPEDMVGLAVKDMGDWISIYSAVPAIPTALFRNMLSYTDSWIYDDNSSDVIYADSNYISVHSLFGGEKTINLPENSSVYDVFNRKLISLDTDSFTFTANGAETRLFRIGNPGEILLYTTHTAGGSITPKGLQTVSEGDSFSFEFKADDGYTLNYLLVDGEKITPSGNSYTFKNIAESHTAVAYFTRVYDKPPLDDEESGNITDNNDGSGDDGPSDDNGSGDNSFNDDTSVENTVSEETVEENSGGKRAVVSEDIIYYTTTSLNWPVIAAAIAGVIVLLAAIVALIILLIRRTDVDFYRNGKRLGGVKVKKGRIDVSKLNKKHGLENVIVCVKSGYVKKHNDEVVTVVLDNIPLKSAMLYGFDDYGIQF